MSETLPRTTIEALEQFKRADEGYRYVVRGDSQPGFDAVAEAGDKTPAVILPGFANDKQLRWLYPHANGFVSPGKLEGFGMPGAEAISRGIVPFLGRGEALHGVVGSSAILVDPLNAHEIADGMWLVACLGQEDRQARQFGLRPSIARFSRNLTEPAWRSALQQALAP